MVTPNEIIGGLVILIIAIFVFWVVILIVAALYRWIFRINEIVNLLKQIAKTDEQQVKAQDASWIFRIGEIVELLEKIASNSDKINLLNKYSCSVCKEEYPIKELIKIDSGQLLCPTCYKILHK
jgi:hypothetical protein